MTLKGPQDQRGKEAGKAPRILRWGRSVHTKSKRVKIKRVEDGGQVYGYVIIREKISHSGRTVTPSNRSISSKIEELSLSNRQLGRAIKLLKRELAAFKQIQQSATVEQVEKDAVEDQDLTWAIDRTRASSRGQLLNQLSQTLTAETAVEIQQRSARGDRERAEILSSSIAKIANKS